MRLIRLFAVVAVVAFPAAAQLSPKYTDWGKPLAVAVELDTTKGTERITSKKAETEIGDALEAAASVSIKSTR